MENYRELPEVIKHLLLDNSIARNILNFIFRLKKSPPQFHYFDMLFQYRKHPVLVRWIVQLLFNATIEIFEIGLVFAVAKQLRFKIQISTYITSGNKLSRNQK